MSEIEQTIAQLESKLSLPQGFFDSLKSEGDWSFILKCHALMESSCSFLLTSYFNNPNFEDVFSRLEMSDKKKGKLAFLQAVGLVVPEEVRFIAGLSELRNKIIHNIQGVNFSFSDHVSSLDKNQRQAFVKSFGYVYLKTDENGKSVVNGTEFALADPKATVFSGVKFILAVIAIQVETKEYGREISKYQEGNYKLMNSLTNASKGRS